MSAYLDVRGGPFVMLKSNADAFLELATEILKDDADDFFDPIPNPELAPEFTSFQACFNGEVGDSFPSKVHKFMEQVGALLEKPVSVLIREDTSDDDRDQYAVAGPTESSIIQESHRGAVQRAAKELSGIPEGHKTLALRLLIDRLSMHEGTRHKTPLHHYFADLDKGAILLACQLRDDGDYDVTGSLNLEAISQESEEFANWKLTAFLKFHADMDHFAKVHVVTDVLTRTDEDTEPTAQKPS